MQDIVIRKIRTEESVPWSLLELADPSIEKIEEYLQTGEVYIALMNDQIIGEYVLVPVSEKTVEVMNIAVDSKWQGKGIGKRLLLDAVQRIKENGYEGVEIGTGNSSVNQIELYKKCGFSIIGIDKGFFLRNYPDPIYENGILCEDMVRMAIVFA
jgi:ribosomal protein S18 acetylase RimI-like enzyme